MLMQAQTQGFNPLKIVLFELNLKFSSFISVLEFPTEQQTTANLTKVSFGNH